MLVDYAWKDFAQRLHAKVTLGSEAENVCSWNAPEGRASSRSRGRVVPVANIPQSFDEDSSSRLKEIKSNFQTIPLVGLP